MKAFKDAKKKAPEELKATDHKSRILELREKRRVEEQKKREVELEQIRSANMEHKRETKRRADEMYRPSSAMQNSFGIRRKGEKQHLEEEFSMYDEAPDDDDLEAIAEDPDEEAADAEYRTLKAEIGEINAKIMEKTAQLELSVGEEEKEDSDEELAGFLEGDESEEEPVEEKSPKEEAIIKLKDKISLLKHRCESGLGYSLF